MPTTVAPRYTKATPNRLPDVIDSILRDSFVLPATLTERFLDGMRPGLASNLLETDKAYIVQFVLPGADPEKFELKITGSEMLIKGIIEAPTFEHARYIWRGFEGGELSETFTLPGEVYGERAEAEFTHGILTVTVPKVASSIPKHVKVLVK